MSTVTLSPKYQVVITKEVRKHLAMVPGEKLEVFHFEGRIEMVPVRNLKRMRGFLKGIDTKIIREKDRV